MSSKPQPSPSADDSSSSEGSSESRQALPFEPAKSRKQAEKTSKRSAANASPVKADKPAAATSAKPATPVRSPANRSAAEETAIPDAVSRRMIRRMAFLCGIPTALGMATFIVSYFLVTKDLFEVPTYAVLLVSLGWFGLGVVGLSYGVLSASWDEEIPGSWAGWNEFTVNLGRMTAAWRSSKNKT